jgi:hypothetical protein
VPDDVKTLLQKFPSILRNGDVKPAPNHGVKHHIHTGSHPPVFAKSRRLDPEKNCKLPKQSSKGWNPLALFADEKHHGLFLCTWYPKKMDRGGLVAITTI